MKKWLFLGSFIFLILLGTGITYAHYIPTEDSNFFVDMWVDPVGLMHHIYDIDGDGIIELETVRRKTIFFLLPDNTVLFTPPRWEENPFIYYVDFNKNGKYEKDEMFLDIESDGINGNEEYLVS